MRQVFEKELASFDRDRVMPALDALTTRQQTTLEEYGVPTMFPSSEVSVKEVRNHSNTHPWGKN